MARTKLREVSARQAVSDRFGYLIAVIFGAVAYRYGGELAVIALVLLYGFSAWVAYRRWRRLT